MVIFGVCVVVCFLIAVAMRYLMHDMVTIDELCLLLISSGLTCIF